MSLFHDRFQIHRSILVCFPVYGKLVLGDFRAEAYKLFIFAPFIADMDPVGINKYHFSLTFGCYLSTAVLGHGTFKACSYDGGLRPYEWHSLAHHVGTHQGPVGVVMFQEWNE